MEEFTQIRGSSLWLKAHHHTPNGNLIMWPIFGCESLLSNNEVLLLPCVCQLEEDSLRVSLCWTMENNHLWIQSVPSSLSSDIEWNAKGNVFTFSSDRQVTCSIFLHEQEHQVFLRRYLQKNGTGNLTMARYRRFHLKIRWSRDIGRIVADRRTFRLPFAKSLKEKEGWWTGERNHCWISKDNGKWHYVTFSIF